MLPRLVDRMLGTPESDPYRARTCAGLAGTVLEVGFGSGLNVVHYPPEVQRVLAVEPAGLAWELAAPRIRAAAVEVERVGLDGQALALPDESVDQALSTMTFCTIPDLPTALGELRRVLRPGGVVHFFEHGHAPDASVARWQRRLEPAQRRIFGGCHLTRPIAAELTAAGFRLTELDTFYLPGPTAMRAFGYVYLGRAAKPGGPASSTR